MSEENKEIKEKKNEDSQPQEAAPKKESSEEKKIKELEAEIEKLKGKLNENQKKFEEADKKADEWKNKYYQAYADMANTRKQVEKETSDFKKYAKQSLVEEMIPALDGFDMALKNEPKDDVIKNYLKGFNMIHSKLLAVLEQQNVTIVNPKIGEDYNPSTMQAFSTVEGEEDNKVAEVFTKGYKMYEHLLRPAGVIVTKKKEKPAEEEKKDEKDAAKDSSEKESENK